MPELPPRSRKLIWMLSKAEECGQLIRVNCGYHKGWRYYVPADLKEIFGDVDVERLSRRMRCEQCNKRDNITVEAFLPVAAERARLTVRRLAGMKIKRTPIWRDEN